MLPATICVALAASPAALANKARAAPEGVTAKFSHWRVTIDGHARRVRMGAAVKYCASETVESLDPTVDLAVRGSGVHPYLVRLMGPKAAGQTPIRERFMQRHRERVTFTFLALEFNTLTREDNAPSFVPGVYHVQVKALIGRGLHRRRVDLVEPLRLAARSGC